MTKEREMATMCEMATRCELALRGKVVSVNDNSEVVPMTEYMMSAMGVKNPLNPNFIKDSICKFHNNKVKYLVCNTVQGDRCITYLMESETDDENDELFYPKPFAEDYGTGCPSAFCYVFNLDCDWCSEFGDCFFEKKQDGFYHRVS